MKNIFRTVGGIFVCIFLLANFVLGGFCLSSIFLTFSVYLSIYLLSTKVIDIFIKSPIAKTNYTLFVSVLLVSFFSVELSLKYIFKTHLSYTERNGELFYRSRYDNRGNLEYLIRKYIYGQEDSIILLHLNTPNTQLQKGNQEFSYTHTYNSLGIRDTEITNGSNLTNIVCLGDSYTEGSGTPIDSTWVSLLQNNLNKDISPTYKCINGGIAGSDPFSEYSLLEQVLYRYKPKIIIVAINTTDIDDIIARGGMQRLTSKNYTFTTRPPWWEYIYQFSYISRIIIHEAFGLDDMLMKKGQRENETKMAVNAIKNCIYTFNSLTQKMGSRLIIVFHPLQRELENNDFPFKSLNNDLQTNNTIEVINLYEEFYYQKNTLHSISAFKDIYWPLDGHHNSKGYKLWADIIAEKLQKDKF